MFYLQVTMHRQKRDPEAHARELVQETKIHQRLLPISDQVHSFLSRVAKSVSQPVSDYFTDYKAKNHALQAIRTSYENALSLSPSPSVTRQLTLLFNEYCAPAVGKVDKVFGEKFSNDEKNKWYARLVSEFDSRLGELLPPA